VPQYRTILDTDIGGDIDDAFALALLLRSPEVTLNEIITVDGDVLARVWTAEAMTRAGGFPYLPINDGCAGSLSRRGVADHPLTYGGQKSRQSSESTNPGNGIRALTQYTPDVLITIGPLTNIAVALACRPSALFKTRMISMCGEFQQEGVAEFNVQCDPIAASVVFDSGVPIDVIPLSIGLATKLNDSDVKRLETSDDRLINLLVEWLHKFWQHEPGKTNMYDPMTVVALLRPELFEWRRGRVSVELKDGPRFGITGFEGASDGPHRVAVGVRADEAKQFMLDRLLGGV
jgi:inosine-uridine nucleoside N-ribohydrolase